MVKKEPELRKAFPADAAGIKSLVIHYADKGWMLPRSLSEVYESIRDFWVLEIRGQIVGCVALQVCWENMAEIRSLAISEEMQRKGWGEAFIKKCLEEAISLGIKRVFTLTFLPEFFQKMGFTEIRKEDLPHKIWKDCINCPHFPDCKEVAMLIEI